MMVCDTNILIAYLNGDHRIVDPLNTIKSEKQSLFIASITTVEVLSLPKLSAQEYKTIKQFLTTFVTIALDDAWLKWRQN